MDISLQKSSIFSAVKSCSRNTLIATSVPFHIPRKTSPKNPKVEKANTIKTVFWSENTKFAANIVGQEEYLPIPTRVPTVSSEKSICHSSKGNKGLFKNGEDRKTLFHVDIKSSAVRKSEGVLNSELRSLNSWGDEGNDIAF